MQLNINTLSSHQKTCKIVKYVFRMAYTVTDVTLILFSAYLNMLITVFYINEWHGLVLFDSLCVNEAIVYFEDQR